MLLADGQEAARAELAPIAYPPRVCSRPRRRSASRRLRCRIFRRDSFCCRYCGAQTILPQVMAMLGALFPDELPFDPNWKGGLTHPAVITRSPNSTMSILSRAEENTATRMSLQHATHVTRSSATLRSPSSVGRSKRRSTPLGMDSRSRSGALGSRSATASRVPHPVAERPRSAAS